MVELVECFTCKQLTPAGACPRCGQSFCNDCPIFCDCSVVMALAAIEMELESER